MVGIQTASLTPGPSFAHNLGCRCPNDQCKGILDIYTSRPFQWHQEHPNARCFGLYCRTLNIRKFRRTPNPQLRECWASPPHLAKVGLRQHGNSLGNVSLHVHILSHSSWPTPLQTFALVASPRLGLRQQTCTKSIEIQTLLSKLQTF